MIIQDCGFDAAIDRIRRERGTQLSPAVSNRDCAGYAVSNFDRKFRQWVALSIDGRQESH